MTEPLPTYYPTATQVFAIWLAASAIGWGVIAAILFGGLWRFS